MRWSRGQEFAVENLAIWPHLLRRSRKVNVGEALSKDLASVLDLFPPMTPSPQHPAGKRSDSCSLLLALLCLASAACSTTAQSGKILFDDPRGTVSLQTISDRSIQANHPIDLEPALLAQLLKGMKTQDGDLGHNHVTGLRPFYSSVPVFSEDQIRFLAPLLAEGLRAAAPDQSVEYRVVTTHEGSNRFQSPTTETTAGSLYAYSRQLYVLLSQYRSNKMRTNMNVRDSYGRENEVDYSGLRDRTLLFTPQAAQRSDSFEPPIRVKLTERFLAIDYQLLQQASASEAHSPTIEALAQEVETLKKQLESVQKHLDTQTIGQDSPERKIPPPSRPQQTAP